MALGKPRDVVTYPDLEAKNLAVSEGDNAAKRIDGVYFDDNNEDTNNALAVRQGHGVDFVDNGSIVGECRVTTPTGLFDAEHSVVIGDGTRIWKTAMTADDDLRFDDNDIVNGAAGPADYSTAGFIDSLVVWSTGSDTTFIMVDNTEIVLTFDATNALTGDDIARSPTNSEVLDTSLTNIETAFDAEHDAATGAHDAGFLEPPMVNEDTVFQEEAWQNIIRYGRFNNWPAGIDSPPEGWEPYGAPPAVAQESGAGNVRVGNYSVLITTDGLSQGIKVAVPNFTDYQGKSITASCWVKQSVAGDVKITIDDGVGATTGAAVTLSGSFQQVIGRRDVDAAASELTIMIHSTVGTPAFYVDEFSAYEGDFLKAHSSHPLEVIAYDDVIPVSLLINGDLGHWWDTTANAGFPDQWEHYNAADRCTYYTTNPHFGHSCMQVDTNAGVGEGVCQKIGDIDLVLNYLKGKTVCGSCWIKELTPGTGKNFKLQIDDGVGSSFVEFDQDDYADWTRVWVKHNVNAAATVVTLSIQSSTAIVVAGLLADGFCLNIGSCPMPWTGNMPSIWSPVRYTFRAGGSVSDATYLDEAWPVPEQFYPTRLDIYCLTGPAEVGIPGTADFYLYTEAAGTAPATTGFYVRVEGEAAPDADGVGATATQTPDEANTDVIAEENYLRIYTTYVNVIANPSDVNVILTGYTLALP